MRKLISLLCYNILLIMKGVNIVYVLGRFDLGYFINSRNKTRNSVAVTIKEYDKDNNEINRKRFYFVGDAPYFNNEMQVESVFNKYPDRSVLLFDNCVVRAVHKGEPEYQSIQSEISYIYDRLIS